MKIFGYIILAFSCLLFILILFVPWLNYAKGTLVLISTVLIVIGEVLFYTSILLIGKDFIIKLKNRLKVWWAKANINKPPKQTEQKQI